MLVDVQVDSVPKLKLHLSAFSWPLASNHAFRSGSEMASSSSCESTLAMPSIPPWPVTGLLGPVVWISQPEGQRSTLPTKAYLMSVPPRVARVWKPQYCVQKPEVSLMLEELITKYTPLASVGSAPLLSAFLTVVCRLRSVRFLLELTIVLPPKFTFPVTLL